MDYEIILNYVLNNTRHSIDSIAEILDLDTNELLDGVNPDKNRAKKLELFSNFLTEYNLISHP